VTAPRYPSLYQINTRVWLTELSGVLGRPATLDDIPDDALDRLAADGFDWVWFLSVWQTGSVGQHVSRTNPGWRTEFEETLPDLGEEDIGGSGFAVTGYTAHEALGGDAALARLRERLRERGLRLMLDFVPNHTAIDHPWVETHPEYYVRGAEADLAREPENFVLARRAAGDLVLAYGRDPYFSGWPDSLQLNYADPGAQRAMTDELVKIAGQCDGVRCDMAMLVLPDVFERTWGARPEDFWPAAIARVRERAPEFVFMAEVYWDMEWRLQQQGFDYTYDKRLYDGLRDGHGGPVRGHLHAGLDYQDKMARFLENHDEARTAATFARATHEAAAVLTFLSPGLRFLHHGQFEGRKKRISPHLVRGPVETADAETERFYEKLLAVLRRPVVRDGSWQLLECAPAWEGNATSESFVAFAWHGSTDDPEDDPADDRVLVAVNYAPSQGQCYVRLPFAEMADARWRLEDLLGDAVYERDGRDLVERGLYLDEPAWKAYVFALTRIAPEA
jgi:hypothetical protein